MEKRRRLAMRTIKTLSVLSALAAATTLSASGVHAAAPVVVQVSNNTDTNNKPIVKNGRVAWTRVDATGHSNIYVYDIASHSTVAVTSDGSARLQAMDGKVMVYSDLAPPEANGVQYFNIFSYDLIAGTTRRLSTSASNEFSPSISGTTVVWDDDRNGILNTDIYGISLSGGAEFPVATDASFQDHPSISGSLVAWQDLRNGPPNIYAVDLSSPAPRSEIAIAVGSTVQADSPMVDSGKVVYAKKTAAGYFNIFVWDSLNGERPVSICACNEIFPRISDNSVVWEDDRNQVTTGLDLYGKNLTNLAGPDLVVDNEPLDQRLHDVDGTNVVFADPRTGTSNVFLITTDPPLTITRIGAVSSGLNAAAGVTFTDTDPQGNLLQYSGTIDWGDGTAPSPALFMQNPLGGFAAGGVHRYARAGIYTITITINDVEGASARRSTTLTVTTGQ
jgi:beta propeller repeat protein